MKGYVASLSTVS